MSNNLSSWFVGSALVAVMGSGCRALETDTQHPTYEQRRGSLSKTLAASLAFPEYDLNVPVEWLLMDSQPATEIQARMSAGFRLHDLEVVAASPLRFSAVFVSNQGDYARDGNDWGYDLTEPQVLAIYADANRRIVSIAQYVVSGQWRYAVVWVSNTGPQQRNYKLVLNNSEPTFVGEATGYRVISMDQGSPTTCTAPCINFNRFSGVMIENTGNDARVQQFGRSTMAVLMKDMRENAANCSNPSNSDAGAAVKCRRLALIEEVGNDDYYYITEEVNEATSPQGFPVLGEGEQTTWAAGLFLEVGNRTHPDSIEHVLNRLGARPHRLRVHSTASGVRYIATFARNDDVVPSAGSSDDGNSVLKEVDAIAARHMRRGGYPGLTVGIVQGGRLVHAKGYGYSDVQTLRVTQPTDLFRVASVSKALTKGAMVRLAHENRTVTPPGGGAAVAVNLATKPWVAVTSYDTSKVTASPNLRDVTVRDLLEHRSGVRFISDEYCNCKDMPAATRPPDCNLVEDVAPCRPFDVESTPASWHATEQSLKTAGRRLFYVHRPNYYQPNACPASLLAAGGCPAGSTLAEQYLNSGYHIVGAVISYATSQSFDTYLRTNFLDPLGLNRVRLGNYIGTPPAGCSVPSFPIELFQAVNYNLPLPYRGNYPATDNGSGIVCDSRIYPASSYSASPIDLLRWATSIDGSTPGYRPLVPNPSDTSGFAEMAGLCGAGGCGVSHGGYLPTHTAASIFEIPAAGPATTVPENLKVAYAINSDVIDRNDFTWELSWLLSQKSHQLPKRDLFSTYVDKCDPTAPFDAPTPAFTGAMNADGLTFSPNGLFAFVSAKNGATYDIYASTRATLSDPFSTPGLMAAMNFPATADQRAPSLTPDGLTLYFHTTANGLPDIVSSTFDGGNGQWSNPTPVAGPWINTSVADQDPFWFAVPGGLPPLMFFASERPDGAHRDLYQTTRVSGLFSEPLKLLNVNSPFEDYRPVLSPDGLTLFFASNRPGGIAGDTGGDVYVATRPDTGSAFNNAVNLATVNTSGVEFPVNISPDGCTLYYASNELNGFQQQNFRLYQAKRGTANHAQVTTRIDVVGAGSVTTAPFNCSTGNVGTCAASGLPGSQTFVWADRQANWSGMCTRNGGNPSRDAVLVFANNGVCTVTFP
jgi:CubicO group peptidase (beta-lactamase class C family)